MADDIKKIIEEATLELRQDINSVGVNVEQIQSDVKQVLEGVEIHTQQLNRLASVPDKLEKMDDRLAAMETTLESVNLPMLKQKVVGLEKRIEILEGKFHLA